jgi:hypothetical protein
MSTPLLRTNHHRSGYLPWLNSSKTFLRLVIMTVGIVSLLWLSTTLLSLAGLTSAADGSEQGGGPPPKVLLTRDELEGLVNNMRGEDMRIMRWHARSFTRKAQKDGGCESMPAAVDLIVTTAATAAAPKENDDDVTEFQRLALEYITFCVTDNPTLRSMFSEVPGIHKAIVALLKSESSAVSASAAHVIYIGSFANKENHYGFFRAGAIAALTDIVLRYPVDTAEGDKTTATSSSTSSSPSVRADQAMWSLAALQNMGASYCRTKNDGRCYWQWAHVEGSPFHTLNIREDSLPVTSEATSMRLTALKESQLVPRLVQLACTLGVKGKMSVENPFPGDNAIVGRDEDSPNLVSWAATGALKNLALDPAGRDQMAAHEAMLLPCMCHMTKRSGDWLERNKAEGLLRHLRYGDDPCWWSDEEDESVRVLQCIDFNFSDNDNYHCGDYIHPTEDECRATDVTDPSLPASRACCGCGGGMRLETTKEDKEL